MTLKSSIISKIKNLDIHSDHLIKTGISVACTYSENDEYLDWLNEDANELLDYLLSHDIIVGFNHINFDYRVLAGSIRDLNQKKS